MRVPGPWGGDPTGVRRKARHGGERHALGRKDRKANSRGPKAIRPRSAGGVEPPEARPAEGLAEGKPVDRAVAVPAIFLLEAEAEATAP